MPFVLAAMLVLVVALPAGASGPLSARVIGMLSGIESLPEQSEWQNLGPEGVPVLISIANDPQQPTFRRARALAVLGYFDDPASTDALENALGTEQSDASLRRHALLGLGRAAPERALPYLKGALDSEDSSVRQVAIKVLSESPLPDARRLLRQRRDREDRPMLVQQIEAALAGK